MTEIYYVKRGRRYVPVSVWDTQSMDALPEGHHLISVGKGWQSRRFDIEPRFAPLLAALRECRDEVEGAARLASQACFGHPGTRPASRKEMKAAAAYQDIMGPGMYWLTMPGAHDIVNALEKALIERVKP